MVSNASTEYDPEFLEFAEQQLATGEQLNPEIFPQLYNLSAGFIFRFVYRPTSITCPEFVYVPFEIHGTELDEEHWAKYELLVCQWNYLWETSQLRYEFFQDDLPAQLSWLTKFSNSNLYLLPHTEKTRYDAYIPLFHLLPQRTLQKYRLPMLRRGFSWRVMLSAPPSWCIRMARQEPSLVTHPYAAVAVRPMASAYFR